MMPQWLRFHASVNHHWGASCDDDILIWVNPHNSEFLYPSKLVCWSSLLKQHSYSMHFSSILFLGGSGSWTSFLSVLTTRPLPLPLPSTSFLGISGITGMETEYKICNMGHFLVQTVRIELVLPQAASCSAKHVYFDRKISSDAPPWGHTSDRIEKRKKAQHPAGF